MKTILEKADSGASQHYFENEGKGVLIEMKPATNQVVNLPNNKVVTSYLKGQITASSVLSKKVRDSHVLKDILIASLVSLGQICDYGCTDILNKK